MWRYAFDLQADRIRQWKQWWLQEQLRFFGDFPTIFFDAATAVSIDFGIGMLFQLCQLGLFHVLCACQKRVGTPEASFFK